MKPCHSLVLVLSYSFIGFVLAFSQAGSQRERVATSGCYYQVPSGSQIIHQHADGSIDVFDSHKQIEVRFPACNKDALSSSSEAISFAILSYQINVTYSSELNLKAQTQVPGMSPPAQGQLWHSYSSLIQPVTPGSTELHALEAVVLFGEFLNSGSSDGWSILSWYWNSVGNLNIVTPGLLVDNNDSITTTGTSSLTNESAQVSVSSSVGNETLSLLLNYPIEACAFSVEANDFPSCADFPPTNTITWDNILIMQDNTPINSLIWSISESVPHCSISFSNAQNECTFTWQNE